MDTLTQYRSIVQSILRSFTQLQYVNGAICNETLFDIPTDRYAVISVGWEGQKRIHSCLLHLDIIDGKIWIQWDGTEDGIAHDLIRAGIPKQDIVLAFHPENIRPYTEYAVR